MVFVLKATGAQKVKRGHGSWVKSVIPSTCAQRAQSVNKLVVQVTISQTQSSPTVTSVQQVMLALTVLDPPSTET